MPAATADAARALLALFGGCAAPLATPGPSMPAIGGIAAARGFARASPVCLGLAAGAASFACAAGLLALPGGTAAARGVGGAALLAWVAVPTPAPGTAKAGKGRRRSAGPPSARPPPTC